jgi:acetylornithine/N-succinyldiaminopimelate aminotransferase
LDKRQAFLRFVGQTSQIPMCLEVERAEGMYIYGPQDQQYLDMNSGISVSSLGHKHPIVTKAIKDQVDLYMHTMVYGEHIQSPQVAYAQLLTSILDPSLNTVYFANCGTEAVEIALKLGRKVTGRSKIISCSKAYHGSTLGSESLRSDTEYTRHFLPGIPDVHHIAFNDDGALDHICDRTALVILEPIQAEAGIRLPKDHYLVKLRRRCNEVGALLVLDEIQTGFGRTGTMFAHQYYGVTPDILLLAKAMGGGMPIGAVVANKNLLDAFTHTPMLGHITTFGGHPVCVAAALATLQVLLEEKDIIYNSEEKGQTIARYFSSQSLIKEVRQKGLFIGVEFVDQKYLEPFISYCIKNGVLIDFFLFDNKSFRIAPPLILQNEHILEAIRIFKLGLEHISKL